MVEAVGYWDLAPGIYRQKQPEETPSLFLTRPKQAKETAELRAHWKTETLADAAVDLANEELDAATDDGIADVRHAARKAGSGVRQPEAGWG